MKVERLRPGSPEMAKMMESWGRPVRWWTCPLERHKLTVVEHREGELYGVWNNKKCVGLLSSQLNAMMFAHCFRSERWREVEP